MSKRKLTLQQDAKPINGEMLDLYSDYLISSFGSTTATGMSAVLDEAVDHPFLI